MKSLNGTFDNVNVEKVGTDKGVQFKITLSAHFVNPFLVTFFFSPLKVGLYVYYKGVPILNVSTKSKGKLGLQSGPNSLDGILVVSNPVYTAQLMEFVGVISDGEGVKVEIRDISLSQNSNWQWIADMLDGWKFSVDIPPMTEEMAKENRNLISEALIAMSRSLSK